MINFPPPDNGRNPWRQKAHFVTKRALVRAR